VPWRSPVIETGLFIGLVLVADAIWGSGDRFMHAQLHPFWAIVLFMAVQYGTTHALLATGASTIALLVGNLPPQAFDQDVHEYTVQILLRPLLWMAASVMFGELRVRHRLQYVETVDRLRNAERRVELLSRAHGEMTVAKERLETRLAGQLRTATGMFEAARELETLDPNEVLQGATDLMNVALSAKGFSLWLLKGDALVLVAAQGLRQERGLAPHYSAENPLFREVVGARRFVSVATPDGERLLEGQGLMAGPLVDPAGGNLFGMLKIEEMTFLDFNLSSLRTFKAMCEWIAAAYANAVTHEANRIEDKTTQLYGARYLTRQVEYLTEVALRFGFDLTLLFFRVDVSELSDDDRHALPAIMGRVSQKSLRRTDLVFSHEPPGTQFAVLLPGTNGEGAVIAARRLVQALRDACRHEVNCTTQVRTLCVAGQSASRQALRAITSDMVA
jgi:GGDEF domain-containing protein